MEVSITQFRRDLFDLAGRALKGEEISVNYRGELLRLVPAHSPTTRFDQLTKLQIVNPNMPDLDDQLAKEAQQSEFEKMWEEKWRDL
jgi:antitoxin (DNA-binding transcriptional repressor) of toxin-antitoxin stability system